MLAKNQKETAKIARLFLQKILREGKKREGALVVGLEGELGAGKTAFTQAVARHLGVKSKVRSPTFIIIKKYPLKKAQGRKFLYHLDAYRLKNEKELLALGWPEIIKDPGHLVFIEWPEKVRKAMPRGAKAVLIAPNKNGHRKIQFR